MFAASLRFSALLLSVLLRSVISNARPLRRHIDSQQRGEDAPAMDAPRADAARDEAQQTRAQRLRRRADRCQSSGRFRDAAPVTSSLSITRRALRGGCEEWGEGGGGGVAHTVGRGEREANRSRVAMTTPLLCLHAAALMRRTLVAHACLLFSS